MCRRGISSLRDTGSISADAAGMCWKNRPQLGELVHEHSLTTLQRLKIDAVQCLSTRKVLFFLHTSVGCTHCTLALSNRLSYFVKETTPNACRKNTPQLSISIQGLHPLYLRGGQVAGLRSQLQNQLRLSSHRPAKDFGGMCKSKNHFFN